MAEELEYRKQQMAIRKQSLEDKAKLVKQISQYGSSRTSEISSVADSRKRVEEWLENSDRQTEGIAKTFSSAVVPDVSVPHSRRNDELPLDNTSKPRVKNAPTESGIVPDLRHQLASMDLNRAAENAVLNEEPSSHTLNFRTHHESRSQDPPRNRPVENLLETELKDSHLHTRGGRQYVEEYDGPTNRQLAARQVMGKDLPPFSGRPEEWPLWFSNFQRSTTTCGFSDDENLIRLQRCLRGEALETVRSKLLCPSSVPHVIRTLEMRYGRPSTLIRVMTERIRQLPSPRMNDLNSIIEFGLAVNSLVEHLQNSAQISHLNNPSLLHDLVTKLPVDYRLKWAAYKSSLREPNLTAFGNFMSTMVELAYEVADDVPSEKSIKQVNQSKPKERAFLHAHSESPSSKQFSPNEHVSKKCCVVCHEEGHKVGGCPTFKRMDMDERYKVVQQNGLCRTCLNQHGRWPCKTWNGCEFGDCRLRHHTLLHSISGSSNVAILNNHMGALQSINGPLFRIMPVTLYGNGCQFNVFAFIRGCRCQAARNRWSHGAPGPTMDRKHQEERSKIPANFYGSFGNRINQTVRYSNCR